MSQGAGGADVNYRVSGSSTNNVWGAQTAWLVPGASWQLCLSQECVAFSVAGDGTVTGPANGAMSYFGGSIMFSAAAPVTVSAGAADAQWRILGASATYDVYGDRTALLLPDSSGSLCIAQTCLSFEVDEEGAVSGPACGSVAFVPGGIAFRSPVEVEVDPNGADLNWRILSTPSTYDVRGPQFAQLVPDTASSLCVEGACVAFFVDEVGGASRRGPAPTRAR